MTNVLQSTHARARRSQLTGSFLVGQHKTKKPTTIINKPGVSWTEGAGFGISSIVSSSLGDRKKGYPKRQALWELTLALGRFPFDFVFFVFLIVFVFSEI